MAATLEQSNAQLRRAVETRLATGTYDEFVVLEDGPTTTVTKPMPEDAAAEVLQQPRRVYGHEGECCRGPSAAEVVERFNPTHPSSRAFYALCDRVKEMHASKSRDYGSADDPLANIRNGAEFVGIKPWQGAMVRLSDKVTRLATYNRTGSLTFEGVEDTLLDLASYSLLALLLYREERGT